MLNYHPFLDRSTNPMMIKGIIESFYICSKLIEARSLSSYQSGSFAIFIHYIIGLHLSLGL